MKRSHILLPLLVAMMAHAGSRVGGPFDIEYESLNSGGTAQATNANVKMGGTLGQSGLVFFRTNALAADSQDGFWKAYSGCELYPIALTNIALATNNIRLIFTTVPSNTYSVAYLAVEGNGLRGVQSWTNIVAGPFVGTGAIGNTTTVYVDASAVTNQGRFFVIRCE